MDAVVDIVVDVVVFADDFLLVSDDVVVVIDDLLVVFDDILVIDDVDRVVGFEVVEVLGGRTAVDVIGVGDDSDVVVGGEFPIPVDMQRLDW